MTLLSQAWPSDCRAPLQWALALAIVPALCSFSNAFANPNEVKWEFLALCNLLILLDTGVLTRGWQVSLDKVDAWLLVFIAYAGASVAWSADEGSGALAIVKWLMLAGPFLYFRHRVGDPFLRLTLVAITLANAAVMFFAITGKANWAGFANENFLAEFQLISLPFLVALAVRESRTAAKLLLSLLIGLDVVDLVIYNPSRIEWLVLLGFAGLGAELLLLRRFGPRGALLATLAGGLVVAAAWACGWWPLDWQKALFIESVRPRLALIVNTLRLWWDAPVFGHGAGSFDALYPIYKEWHLQYFEHADILLANKMVKAGAAHNEFLQFLAEYGLAGIAVLGGFGLQVLRQGRVRRDVYAMAGAAALASGLLIGLIEFPLQNPATALLLALTAAMLSRTAGLDQTPTPAMPASRGYCVLNGVATACVGTLLALGVYRFDQSNRQFGEVAGLLGTDPKAAFVANQQAFELNPWDRRIRMQLYTTLTFWTENSAEPVSSPDENDRIFELSSRGAEHQPVLLLGRLQHLLNSGRYEERVAETEALLATLKGASSRMADVWILDAYHALLQEDRARAAEAIRRAQALDPSPAQRENLQRLREGL